jgi:ABC-2 type transport system permease protein
MMFFKLTKIFFKENYSFKRLVGINQKSSLAKKILIGFLIVYGLASVLFSFGFLFFEIGRVFKETNSLDSMLTYIFMYATFLSVFFIILRASAYLFNYKDYDFLTSLPIKNEVVLGAKITVMMVMVYISVYLVSAPMIFSYFYHGGFSLNKLITILISLLFIPILPLVVFSFFSLLINFILNKLGIHKIFTIVFTFAILLGYMYFAFTFTSGSNNPFLNQQAFLESMGKFIPTIELFFNGVANNNILQLILFIVINVALLGVYVYAIKDLVHITNQNQTKSIRRRKKVGKLKQRTVTESLILKEVKKFFSVNIYVMNSGFGPLLMIVGGVLAIFYSDRISSFANQLLAYDVEVSFILLGLVGFLLSTVFTSAISLSLEGDNFWLIRSLPIKPKTIMMSKMLFNVLLGLPFALFFVGAVTIALRLEFLKILLIMLVVVSYSLVTSIFGSIINLYFPKFKFKNETEVVKQSLGAFIGMFSGFGLIVILGLSYAYVFISLPTNLVFIIFVLINMILFVLSYIFIDKKVESLFMTFS